MIDNLKHRGFAKGSLISREGDDGGPLYVIEKGRARAFAGVDGGQRNLAFYREGDFFGEWSILSGSSRAASVAASTARRVLRLDPKAVRGRRDRSRRLR